MIYIYFCMYIYMYILCIKINPALRTIKKSMWKRESYLSIRKLWHYISIFFFLFLRYME